MNAVRYCNGMAIVSLVLAKEIEFVRRNANYKNNIIVVMFTVFTNTNENDSTTR